MTGGRPREFDRTEVLERAMDAFWAHGYEATSIQDLVECMGINRGSLYAAFGGKRRLFIEALDHYGERAVADLRGALSSEESPRLSVEEFVRKMADSCTCNETAPRGCFLVNSVAELAPHDPDIAAHLTAWTRRFEDLLTQRLTEARDCGEIESPHSPRALARALLNTEFGLLVLGKSDPSRRTVRDIVEVALSALG